MKFILAIIIFGQILILCAQPLQNRILIASSYDGLTFQKLNIIFCDSADVPDAIIGPSGAVYVYYQGLITPWIDGIKVAISDNGIDGWQHFQVNIPNTNWPGKPCDPDVVMFGDTFRLYFTGDPINDGKPETYSAVSLDGINFTKENGIRFEVPGYSVLDPSLLWTQDTLQYFAGGAPQNYNWHAHSTDGLNFIPQPNFNINNLMLANGIALNTGGYRFYCFSNQPIDRNIRSIYSTTGQTWMLESGYRLLYDSTNLLEYLYVKDPAIVFKDSIYLMYYVTRKRNIGIEQNTINCDEVSFAYLPSPAKKPVIILSPSLKNRSIKVKIYNPLGKLIKEVYSPYQERLNISISEKGIFFITVESANTKLTRKVIVVD